MSASIIAVRGLAGSGKSTACQILCDIYDADILSVADHMKAICAHVFQIPTEYMYGDDKTYIPALHGSTVMRRAGDNMSTYMVRSMSRSERECSDLLNTIQREASLCAHRGYSVREILQHMGTQWGRTYAHKPDVWVANLLHQISRRSSDEYVIVDSVRFLDEVQALSEANATIIRIERESVKVGCHESELALLQTHPDERIVRNDGSEFDLRQALLAVL